MTEIPDIIFNQFQQSQSLELVAVIFAIAYLLLAVRENILCWPMALISTGIFLFVFWQVRLYMESALQIYYVGMAIYGWYLWLGAGDTTLAITRWNAKQHSTALLLVAAATLLSGTLLHATSDAYLPFLDSFTTWASVLTTYMVAQKILENWIYWLAIDAISIYLYLDRGLYFTALLFALYIIIIFFGWFSWLKSYRQTTLNA